MTCASDLREDAEWAGATIGLEGFVAGVAAARSLAGVGLRIGALADGGSGETGGVAVSPEADESTAVLLIGDKSAAGGIALGWG